MSAIGASTIVAYRRRASPLHAAQATIAAVYGLAFALSALLLENPVLLASLLISLLLSAGAAGSSRQLLRVARVSVIPLLLATVVVNVLVSRGGITVFARLGDWGVLGQMNLTVEAVVYGLVFGLRLLVVSLACLLVVCAADPDQLLFALRRVSPRSALTAALTTRLVGVLAEDSRRLAEAQRCRPDGGVHGARGRLQILRATVAGALDRALDVAAVLEMRGYGSEPRSRYRARTPLSRHDLAFSVAAVALPLLTVAARVQGAAHFDAYPLVSMAAGPATFLFSALFVLIAMLPFADRRGIEP
jgi:energy-coupling factor transport system permease protein